MKAKLMVAVALLILVFGVLALYAGVACPACGAQMYATGNTKVDDSGVLLWEYQCEQFSSHVYWLRHQ